MANIKISELPTLDSLPDGAGIAVTSGGKAYRLPASSLGGTGSYNDLTEKPQINGVELSGNKTLEQLGAAAASHTHSASDVTSGTLSVSRGGTGQTSALSAAKALGRGYGTCSTAAATAAKTVTLTSFALNTGAVVGVKFTYANTAASPTLNINNTGAKSIRDYRTYAAPAAGVLGDGVHFFQYTGTYWVLLNPLMLAEKRTSVALTSTGWSDASGVQYKAVSVSGVTAGSVVFVSPAQIAGTPDLFFKNLDVYTKARIAASGQGAGTLTFVCETPPSETVYADVLILEGAV